MIELTVTPFRLHLAITPRTSHDGTQRFLIKSTRPTFGASTVRIRPSITLYFPMAKGSSRHDVKAMNATTSPSTLFGGNRRSVAACRAVSKAYSRTLQRLGVRRSLLPIAHLARTCSRACPLTDLVMTRSAGVVTPSRLLSHTAPTPLRDADPLYPMKATRTAYPTVMNGSCGTIGSFQTASYSSLRRAMERNALRYLHTDTRDALVSLDACERASKACSDLRTLQRRETRRSSRLTMRYART